MTSSSESHSSDDLTYIQPPVVDSSTGASDFESAWRSLLSMSLGRRQSRRGRTEVRKKVFIVVHVREWWIGLLSTLAVSIFPKYIFVTRTHTLSTPANGNEIAHPGKTCNEENANETKSNEGKSDEDWDN
ncbi:hypothetical protein M430DRAFT_31128 [Amorphotheca resinae ATCC 22711]|uniref:Uncharacterized protein n=1 Tax=Amorphotheca resinae ATCC 22711 TaxID=857342 RepID=A0A2T3ASA8_AMORE|nr:hypothetical protein M430DRAFT_31128 [Amorphotheca resinae ATCC 22711]PSS09260.1 hypothetical protein M430DRAFT_31128 [Amorphotheca resinae ATCC 22711]